MERHSTLKSCPGIPTPVNVANHLVKIARPAAETPFPLSSPVDALITVTYRQRQDKLATEPISKRGNNFAVEPKVSHVCTSYLAEIFVNISKLQVIFPKKKLIGNIYQKFPKIYNCGLTYFDNFFLTRNQAFVPCSYSDWNPDTWVLIWETSVRAIQWIPTWHSQGLGGFQKYLCPCASDESSLSNGRVKKIE